MYSLDNLGNPFQNEQGWGDNGVSMILPQFIEGLKRIVITSATGAQVMKSNFDC